ncbi:MAG: alpha/beta fold hydrolase [Actinomycetota bacterium]
MDLVKEWEDRGRFVDVGGRRIFCIDIPADVENREPLLMLHGFPTSSFDWRAIIDPLARDRRVVSLDWLGFGLSDKPVDVQYSLFDQASIAEEVARLLGLERAAVVSHDMGDSIAAELYARSIEGKLGFEITNRILTNGSIYIEMAQLSPGQQMLLAMDDVALPLEIAPTYETYAPSITAIFGDTTPTVDELRAQWDLLARNEGQTILPRTIRYIEERRVHEGRWIAALRDHPSPITVVWGDRDPIAVYPMAERFVSERPGTPLVRLDGVGHFPMIEAPHRLYDAIEDALGAG